MITYEVLRRACTSALADRGELNRLNAEEIQLLERGSLGVLFDSLCSELDRRTRTWGRVLRAGLVALALALAVQLLPTPAAAAFGPLSDVARAGLVPSALLALLAFAVAFARCMGRRARERRVIYGNLRDATTRFSLLLQHG